MPNRPNSVPPELEDVANLVGDFIEYWGFKNVHGRIWAHLYLSPHPLDAGTLMERLSISKALASMSLAELIEFEVVELAGKSERGTVVYRANPKVMSVITNVLRKRERRLLSRVSAASRLLRDLPKDGVELDCDRVKSLIKMTDQAETVLEGILTFSTVDFAKWENFNAVDIDSDKKNHS